jgi:hypothetical protein
MRLENMAGLTLASLLPVRVAYALTGIKSSGSDGMGCQRYGLQWDISSGIMDDIFSPGANPSQQWPDNGADHLAVPCGPPLSREKRTKGARTAERVRSEISGSPFSSLEQPSIDLLALQSRYIHLRISTAVWDFDYDMRKGLDSNMEP